MNCEKITAQLDAVRKYCNHSEYRTVHRASCNGHEATGDGKIIRRVLAQVHEAGASLDALVEVYRGETLCFRPTPLKTWVLPRENPIQRSHSEAA